MQISSQHINISNSKSDNKNTTTFLLYRTEKCTYYRFVIKIKEDWIKYDFDHLLMDIAWH